MARGYRPGQIARSLIRGVGDADVALAGAEARPEVLRGMEEVDIEQARAAGRKTMRPWEEKIAKVERRIAARDRKRERRIDLVRAKVEQGRLWRSIGIQERIPNLTVPMFVRTLVLLLLAALDFYIFAQAYAVVENVAVGSSQWWLGGLLGLAVFVAGIAFAHSLKTVILSRAQQQMLTEAARGELEIDPEIRKKLVTTKPSHLALWLSGGIFVGLLVIGVIVRYQGSIDQSLSVIAFQAAIPLVAVAVELYLYDPTERQEPGTGWIDTWLQRKRAKLETRLEALREQMELAISRIQKMYGVEQGILNVEQIDMGLHRNGQPE